MALLALAYPELCRSDYVQIQEFRKQHDELYYHVVEPHFTLVFSVGNWQAEPFIAEIRKQAEGIRSFDFCLRCATVNKDAFGDYYHTFLVPDEGYSHIVKLHDQLHSDLLFSHRRLDVDFIPHIGMGNSKDPSGCIEMVRAWNDHDFAIPGRILVLDVVSFEDKVVRTIERLSLAD